ncbi:VirK family protein [Trinickia sp.]|uniref:VirK family protein n=1 Tax=Trinickia sp. TaxID=2571163 RepID=UPI003F7E0F47
MTSIKSRLLALSIAAGLWSAHASAASQLSNVEQVEDALNHGTPVSVAVDLTRCAPAGTTTRPGTTRGGLKITSYRITPDGTLSFADEHASVAQDGSPLWQFIRYQVKPDQTVAFSTDIFSLPSYARLMPEINYTCAINHGIEFFADRH